MPHERLRFGPFELDVAAGRLTEDGRVVRIQPQPLKVLAALAEHSGNVVSRDDLRRRIWDNATFVEFDQGLNYCIRQIRLALRDHAASPTYVETIKGQGYRFLAPVEVERRAGTGDALPEAARPPAASEMPPDLSPAPSPSPQYGRLIRIGAAALLTAGTVGAWFAWMAPARTSPASSTPPAMHQLTDFTDSALAPTLSPDGRMLAFIRGNRDFMTPDQIYVKMMPDGEPRRLTSDPRMKYGPVFSPDGTEIAYTVMENSGWATYSVSVLGGEPHLLLTNAAGLSWLDAHRLLFSEIDDGQHMGLVTGDTSRANLRRVYFPAHERAMTHYAFASPDRRLAIVVEMDEHGVWRPCRLVSLAGQANRTVGPDGRCTAAAWSPDGRWMYFAAYVEGEHHVWRQFYPDGTPEQLTSGPTDEEGVAITPDGHSLITSVGNDEHTLWLHADGEDRQLSSEGDVVAPGKVSADGQTIYYLQRRRLTGPGWELRRRSLATDRTDTVFPGVSIFDFDLSPDGRQVVYTENGADGRTHLWIGPTDKSAPATAIGQSGDVSPHFGPNGDILFQFADGGFNYLGRMQQDGTGRGRLVPYPISLIEGISPGRRWILAVAPLADHRTVAPVAIPTAGGDPIRICDVYCHLGWSSDDRYLIVSVAESSLTSPGRALAIPVGPDEALPLLPPGGLRPFSDAAAVPGAKLLNHAQPLPTTDLDTYLYVRNSGHRNLFRIDLQ